MDDSCAVCAESLEWVAYGACGHKDVCSTCVARLRFICDDRRCCICKTESKIVFVTKALGDYTKTISDFSVFPVEVKEGRVGQYWYHEDTQAFFDDLDHYKMIKAMCRLSCSVCDKMEGQPVEGSRRRGKFRNIEQLKGHLFHQHRLVMCNLCLEGRKVFICEQKLYSRAQLTQHISTGDSEVDGTESERGGFTGHPMCEFCRTPFYGDNELYIHMSTEHYTCHICQRQHPGQFEYYRNYDDLEMHFRRDHFLCEDEACLAKKFIVFPSEAELKRHNTLEHGGRMSRSRRSAALQIPTSFRYRRNNEQETRRGRGRSFRRDTSDNELSLAIQASLETANSDGRPRNTASSSGGAVADHGVVCDVDTLIPPLESLSAMESDPPSRYLQALSQNSRSTPLGESSFPPLAVAPGSSQQNSHADASPKNTMAERLRSKGNRKPNVSNSAPTWAAASRTPAQGAASHAWPVLSSTSGSASSSGQNNPLKENGSAPPSYLSSVQARSSTARDSSFSSSSSSSKNWTSTSRMSHSTSAPNLSERSSIDSSSSEFPLVSAAHTHKLPATNHNNMKGEDLVNANKSLVEKMRAALGNDEEKFSSFKVISGEYRQGSIDAETYLAYVVQYGLSHLVLDMARLLPDTRKQKELIDIYNANLVNHVLRDDRSTSGVRLKESNSSQKGKGKSVDSGDSSSRSSLAENIISTVKELQSSYKRMEEEVQVLSKDGYRSGKGKSRVVMADSHVEWTGPSESTKTKSENESSAGGESNQNLGNTNAKSKQRKKTSKFHRVRLGGGSVEALLDLRSTNPEPDPDPNLNQAASDGGSNPIEGLPVRGVWRNGGGQRLAAITSRVPKS